MPILLTHYHWDHVLGLPFFAPLYRQGLADDLGAGARSHVRGSRDDVQVAVLPGALRSAAVTAGDQDGDAGDTTINGFEVGVLRLNHPGGAFAYRIQGAGGDLVYATDHEFGDPKVDAALAAFAAGASAVILDAHFTPEEMPAHKGWGHSDWSQCAAFAAGCGAEHLWLFHHKPGRTDDALKGIEAQARQLFAATDAAGEGDSFIV